MKTQKARTAPVDAVVGRLISEHAQAIFDADSHRVVVVTNTGVVEVSEHDIVSVVSREQDFAAKRDGVIPVVLDAIAIRVRNGNTVWSIGRRFDLPTMRRPFDDYL